MLVQGKEVEGAVEVAEGLVVGEEVVRVGVGVGVEGQHLQRKIHDIIYFVIKSWLRRNTTIKCICNSQSRGDQGQL